MSIISLYFSIKYGIHLIISKAHTFGPGLPINPYLNGSSYSFEILDNDGEEALIQGNIAEPSVVDTSVLIHETPETPAPRHNKRKRPNVQV